MSFKKLQWAVTQLNKQSPVSVYLKSIFFLAEDWKI